MSDLENLFEEDVAKDTNKSAIKSLTDRFKKLIEVLYVLNIVVLAIATFFAVVYIFNDRYIDDAYIFFVLFGALIFWIIHELTFGMIATVIEVRDGIAKLNSKEDPQ